MVSNLPLPGIHKHISSEMKHLEATQIEYYV